MSYGINNKALKVQSDQLRESNLGQNFRELCHELVVSTLFLG